MKSGYLYVLVHPSDPDLYKVGQTTRHPEKRLIEHNSNYSEHAGRIVKETGQEWELKTYIAVPDPNWAETVFWGATRWANIPSLGGIEVQRMEWKEVQAGLEGSKEGRCTASTKAVAGLCLRVHGMDEKTIGRTWYHPNRACQKQVWEK